MTCIDVRVIVDDYVQRLFEHSLRSNHSAADNTVSVLATHRSKHVIPQLQQDHPVKAS
jgi:hypothetical protein